MTRTRFLSSALLLAVGVLFARPAGLGVLLRRQDHDGIRAVG